MREAEIPISARAAATIGFLRLILDDLRRLADLDTTNVEAIRHIAEQCDRQIADLLTRVRLVPWRSTAEGE